ncbi:MAG: FxsA family protein, partial [Gammaproteobacteria bacterium]|nr:FxsA family protein [Gammaproteobacteria bacterium]
FSTALKVRSALEHSEIPAIELIEGVLLLLCGLLLLLPGFITDFIGFLCLVPQLRRALILGFLRRSNIMVKTPMKKQGTESEGSTAGPRVIEGEYKREDD